MVSGNGNLKIIFVVKFCCVYPNFLSCMSTAICLETWDGYELVSWLDACELFLLLFNVFLPVISHRRHSVLYCVFFHVSMCPWSYTNSFSTPYVVGIVPYLRLSCKSAHRWTDWILRSEVKVTEKQIWSKITCSKMYLSG